LRIDEEITGKRAAAEQHRAEHFGAVRQTQENAPPEAARQHGGGLDENPVSGSTGGAADPCEPRHGSLAGNHFGVMVSGREADGFFVRRQFDVFRVDAGAARAAVGFRVHRGNPEIGQGDPFAAADD